MTQTTAAQTPDMNPPGSRTSFPDQESDTLPGLVTAAKEGDKESLSLLCERFAPLIHASAWRYRGLLKEREDLEQCGWVYFLEAVRAFRPDLGVYFPFFAAMRVRGGIHTCVRRLERTKERTPTLAPPPEQGGDDPATRIPDPQAVESYALAEWVDLLTRLSPRERLAIEYTVIRAWTTTELSSACGVNRESAKTWRKRALRKLGQALREG